MGMTVSFVFVRTSASDVVRMFGANGLYSPVTFVFVGVLLVDDETTSNDDGDADDDDDDAGGETEPVDETLGTSETIEELAAGVRWPGCEGINGVACIAFDDGTAVSAPNDMS
jgi:hypothetical protein